MTLARVTWQSGKTGECSLNDKTHNVFISASLSLCTDLGMILKCTDPRLVIAVVTTTCFW